MSNNNKSNGGIGLLGVLQIVFLVLKLCGVIDWAWGLVLIPLWISLAGLVVSIIIAFYMQRYFRKYNPHYRGRGG